MNTPDYMPAEREREHLDYLQAIDRAFAAHCKYMAAMYAQRGAADLAAEWKQQGEAADTRIARREPAACALLGATDALCTHIQIRVRAGSVQARFHVCGDPSRLTAHGKRWVSVATCEEIAREARKVHP